MCGCWADLEREETPGFPSESGSKDENRSLSKGVEASSEVPFWLELGLLCHPLPAWTPDEGLGVGFLLSRPGDVLLLGVQEEAAAAAAAHGPQERYFCLLKFQPLRNSTRSASCHKVGFVLTGAAAVPTNAPGAL